jgi:SAM-dependent methyltransferase
MLSSRLCPVCESSHKETLYRRCFSKLSNGLLEGYDVVSCLQCGFCFADQLPCQAEFDTYYLRQSKYERECRGGRQSEFDSRHRPLTAAAISEWVPDRTARIVDIGCANGDLLAELKKHGYENITGIDPSPACARAADELYKIKVITAPVSKIPRQIAPFDLVILSSVLEHILDLRGATADIRQLLRPGGAVYLEVPDMTRCSLINDAPFMEFSVEHINYFGPISLCNLWRAHHFNLSGMRQTAIEQVPGLVIRDIKALFRCVDDDPSLKLDFDTVTRPELLKYIDIANAKLNRIERTINALADSQQPLIVWGVGTHTQGLLATTKLREANIAGFVDSNARYVGQRINGVPVLPASALNDLPHDILVSSQQFQTEIVDQIRNQLRLPNKTITLY